MIIIKRNKHSTLLFFMYKAHSMFAWLSKSCKLNLTPDVINLILCALNFLWTSIFQLDKFSKDKIPSWHVLHKKVNRITLTPPPNFVGMP